MSLPALSKTYSARRDVPLLDTSSIALMTKSFFLALVRALTNVEATGSMGPNARDADSVWTVLRSCDSVNVATGSNNWTGLAALVGNTNGSDHSWIVLENVPIGLQLVIDLNSTLTSSNMRMCATKIANPFSTGTKTTAPISSKEWNLGVIAGGLGSISPTVVGGTLGGTNLFHFVTADDGQFYCMMNRLGYGSMSAFLALQKTENADPADLTNTVLLQCPWSETTRGHPSYGSGLAQQPNCTGRVIDDSDVGYNNGGVRAINYGGSLWTTQTAGKTDINRGFPSFKVEIGEGTANKIALRGNIVDWRVSLFPENKINSTYPDGVTPTYLAAGDLFLPWDGPAPTT